MKKLEIGSPTNVTYRLGVNSPIMQIDAAARRRVGNWSAAPLLLKAEAVFWGFIDVFRARKWRYAAGGYPGILPTQILLGTQTMAQLQGQFGVPPSLDCGRIRNLLSTTMTALLPVTTADARISGLFVTKPLGTPPPGVRGRFECIDPTVYGNVRTTLKPYQLVGQCLFQDHYAVKVNETGIIYDACLMSMYTDISVVCEHMLKASPGASDRLIQQSPPVPGGPRPAAFQKLPAEETTGFSMGYLRL